MHSLFLTYSYFKGKFFAGIDGFRLAFESQGAKCIFSAEMDKHACLTYEANFVKNPFCDISTLNLKDIPDFNILYYERNAIF